MELKQQYKETIKLLFMKKQLYLLLLPLFILIGSYFVLANQTTELVNPVKKITITNRAGKEIPSEVKLDKEEDSTFSYSIKNEYAEVKIKKSTSNPEEKEELILVDKPSKEESDKDIQTNILFVDDSDLKFESAEVKLTRTSDKPINAILTCPTWNFNKEIGTCNKWEIADITPTINEDSITFNVNHFSAYAGAYLEILNVQSDLTVNDTWEVRFNTYGTSDLNIETIDGTVWGNDITYTSFYCGNTEYPDVFDGSKVFIPNYSCDGQTSKILNTAVGPGIHTLEFTFGDSKEIAHNFACDSGTLADTCNVSSTQAISNGSTISGTGNLVIQSGGNLTTNSAESFTIDMDGYVTIQNGGAITGNLTSLTGSALTIESTGSINANTKGYASSTGTGEGANWGTNGNGGGGAGHGGAGGDSNNGTAGGIIYGDLSAPTTFGSGGGTSGSSPGGAGGGAININVTGTASIAGTISANGGNGTSTGGTNSAGGGGAGGSIYITADTISGAGTITSDGGSGANQSNPDGGGGGGGRIALYYTTKTFSGTLRSIGGSGPDPAKDGAAGTIYQKPSGQTYADLTFDNTSRNIETPNQLLTGTYTFNTINLVDKVYFDIQDGVTITVTSAFNPTGSYTLNNSSSTGTIDYPALDVTMSGTVLISGDSKWPLQDVTVSSGTLTVNGDLDLRNLTLETGTTLNHTANTTTQTYDAQITASGDITLNGTSSINLNSLGYSASNGPGEGTDGSGVDGAGGGGHGGNGGGGETGIAGGSSYGSQTNPVTIGSGGGTAISSSGGAGGGAITLDVTGTTTLGSSSSITANGGTGGTNSSSRTGGGGAGGSIKITTGVLAGSGTISANGGTGGNGSSADGGGGAGGRMSVFASSSTYSGSLTVTGGIGPDTAGEGEDGTTYNDLSAPTVAITAICSTDGNGCTVSGTSADPQEAYAIDSIAGTASEPDSSLESIQISIKDTDTNRWYSTSSGAFDQVSEFLFTPGTISQSLPYTGSVTWSADTSSVPWVIDNTYTITAKSSNPRINNTTTKNVVFSNSPPTVSNATASQGSDGHVDITYDVTDVESASTTVYLIYDVGATLSSNINDSVTSFTVSDASRFPSSGTAIIGNEFITYTSKSGSDINGGLTRGATNTTAISHTSGDTVWILATGATGDVGSVTNGTSKAIDWTAKTDQDGLDYDTMKIRVVANDGASSSMIGSDEPASFAIDVKDPALSAIFRIDASLSTPLIYVPCTDENTIQMKLGTASDLTGSNLQTFASSINFADAGVTYTAGMSLYGQCTDPYSNSTAIQTAVIPGIPANMFYQDVSNPSLSDYREFLAWGVISTTSIAFDSYKIYRSEDGGAYSLLTSISDRQTNYYVDLNLDETIEYSYKIKSVDANGNTSAFSSVITDTPNGSGGTDLSTPTVSSVSSSSVTATSATITWTTDKLSNSTVYLEATSSYPGSNKADYDSSQGNPSVVTSHSVVLSGLSPSTTYSFLVESVDANDNSGTSSNNSYQFTTSAGPQITNVSVTSVLDDQAVITWKTSNVTSTSYVIFSKNADLSNPTTTRGSDDLVSTHSITLTGLDIGTTYYFYVRSTDGSANTSENKRVLNGAPQYYSLSTTVDTVDPVISSVTVKLTGEKGATITWTTDENSTSTVNWGTTTSLGQTTEITDIFTTYHSISLTNLTTSTKYYFTVSSTDNSGNSSTSSQSNFTTSSATTIETTVEVEVPITDSSLESQVADTISSLVETASEKVIRAVLKALAKNDNLNDLSEESLTDLLLDISSKGLSGPTIGGSNLTIEPGSTTAVVSWVTNRASNSLVAYVKADSYDGENSYAIEAGDSSASVTEHTVTLEGLEPETTYHIQSRSKGSFGPMAYSSDNTFTTTSLTADIDNIRIDEVNENAATLGWETTIPTKSKIVITDTTTGEAQTFDNPNFIKDHSFTTEELNPSTNYTAQVISIDEKGAETESSLITFSTVLNSSPPTISDVRVVTSLIPGKVEQVQTIISWKTNKPSTSKVLFDEGVRPNGELRLSIPEDSALRREHLIISSAFTPGKVYSYRVQSVDTGGNEGKSQNYTLLTPQPRESVVDLIVNNLEEMFGFLK